jgi:DNA-binding NtrC family response regulator
MNPILRWYQNDEPKSVTLTSDFTTLGSDASSAIRTEEATSEPRHARIERKTNQNQTQFILRDLRTTKGTFLNGARIIEAILSDGDIISVGLQEFIFSEDREAEQIDSPFLKSKNTEYQKTLSSIPRLARSEFPVLLLGPSGTGKDVIANTLHSLSLRREAPFVSVNCSALSESLIESELFGHVKGSYTGATNDRKGAFEAAREGTLFLDEIGELPLHLQAKLLRALENHEIKPVGSDKTITTNVRIISATHQNLKEKVARGAFRADLFYRLNVIQLQIPALEDRKEDFESLIFQFARAMKISFSVKAIEKLKEHSWPGNIRELKNTVCRAAALYRGQRIELEHCEHILDTAIVQINTPSGRPQTQYNHSTSQLPFLKELEREMIMRRLEVNQGNQRRTAADLGMPKSTLHDRLKTYNISLEDFSGKKDSDLDSKSAV